MIDWNKWTPACFEKDDDENDDIPEKDCKHQWIYFQTGKRVCGECLINDRGKYESDN